MSLSKLSDYFESLPLLKFPELPFTLTLPERLHFLERVPSKVWLTLAALGGCYVCVTWYYHWVYGQWVRQGVPGPTPRLFIGTMHKLLEADTFVEADMKLFQEYGQRGYVGVYSGSKPVLLVSDAEMIKEVMIKQFDKFTNRPDFDTFHPRFLSKELARTRDHEWKKVRTLLSPTFTGAKLKRMVPLINAIGSSINKKLGEISETPSKEFELRATFRRMTMDILCSVVFGMESHALENPDDNRLAQAGFDIINEFDKVGTSKALQIAFLVPIIGRIYSLFVKDMGFDFSSISVLEKLVHVVRKERKSNPNYVEKHDFLHAVLDEYEKYEESEGKLGFDYETMIGQIVTFLLAGFDTTSNLLMWCTYNLAMHPNYQKQLYDEICSTLGDKEHVEYEDLAKLNFMEYCLLETLRMNPIFRTMRECKQDTVIGRDRIRIKKGWVIEVPNNIIHYDYRIYDSPEEFRPQRFSPEEVEKRKNQGFNAFGSGPRNCIGMRMALFEAKMALLKMVRNYELLPAEDTPRPKDLKYKRSAFREPATPIKLKVEKRNR